MRILGIDPGLRRTGYGVVDAESPDRIKLVEAGVIKTSELDGIAGRLSDIYRNLTDIINEHSPEVLVLEKLYSHYKHPATAILMGHARGVICLGCGVSGVRLVSYPSTRIKKAITGNGQAGKHQVQSMVKAYLNLKKDPEYFDVSDALAIAISHARITGAGKRK